MSTRLMLIRHGETDENENLIFGGSKRAGLNERGQLKAEKLAHALAKEPIDVIYSSIYLKTVETAKFLSREKELPVIVSEELNEIEGGAWENSAWEEIRAKWPHEYNMWFNEAFKLELPDGESMDSFKNRLIGKVRGIVNQNIDKTICLVTHQYAISLLMSYFKGVDYHLVRVTSPYGYTSVSIVDIEQGKFTVLKEADVSHLRN